MNQSLIKNERTCIELTTSTGGEITFEAGFDGAGKYFETKTVQGDSDDDGHTISAYFDSNFLTIDGDGWRDLEDGGYLKRFLSEVIFGNRNAEEFLSNVSEALDLSFHDEHDFF